MNKRYLGRLHRQLNPAQKVVSQEQNPVKLSVPSVPSATLRNIRNVVNNFLNKK